MAETLFLADFSVIKPDPGLILWTSLIFLIVWGLLAKFAFRPIQEALKKREYDIQSALDESKKAREEIASMQAENDKLLAEAREERAQILKEAKAHKDAIIKDAKEEAKTVAKKMIEDAKMSIDNQRMAVVTDLKNQLGVMALEIAEQVIRKELKGDAEQEAFVNKLVDDVELN
ncbi:MAG: F0F1 ATP synthase subunit B [Saprospiraceae bacterium]